MLSKVVIPIIFSTKDRHPWLDANVRARMHAYLATICRDADYYLGHPHGFHNHIYLAEIYYCHPLFDPAEVLRNEKGAVNAIDAFAIKPYASQLVSRPSWEA